jgi:hypothetical protein
MALNKTVIIPVIDGEEIHTEEEELRILGKEGVIQKYSALFGERTLGREGSPKKDKN